MASVLWLVDRSRFESGTGRCQGRRYFEYHFGPTGYGIQRKAQSIPLVTGIQVHDPIGTLLHQLVEQQAQQAAPLTEADLDDTLVRQAIVDAVTSYNTLLTTRGLDYFADQPDLLLQAEEQRLLIRGLVWLFVLEVLPVVLRTYRLIEVETERTVVLGCTCGLGLAGSVADHEARDCDGIGFMTRPDMILQDRFTGAYHYWDLKTTGFGTDAWAEAFETKVQLSCGALGFEVQEGQIVDQSGIVGLFKGKRESEWNPETGSKSGGAVFQNSPLVYGWRREAVPGVLDEDWKASYYYVSSDNKRHKLTREYKRTVIAKLPESWWNLAANPENGDGCDSPSEYWLRVMAPVDRANLLRIKGPLNQQPELKRAFQQELVTEEHRWRARVWALYEAAEACGGNYDAPEFKAAFSQQIVRSWECRRFGKRYGCDFEKLCFGSIPLGEALSSGQFILRRPHHQPELQQAEARGIPLPQPGEAESGEGEG